MTKHAPTPHLGRVVDFLRTRLPNISDEALLHGGAWSSAFGFRSANRELVVRFGAYREDYEKDQIAAAWTGLRLPVPNILEVGDAFDAAFAISARHHGDALAALPAARFAPVIVEIFTAIAAINAIELPGKGFGIWLAPHCDAPYRSWQDYLVSIAQREDERLSGWPQRLAMHKQASAVFDDGRKVLERLVVTCPNIRKVVHNDLLGNVLVDDDDHLSAVLDWGNSLAGDPLYDVALLRFSAPWYPALDVMQVIALARKQFDEGDFESRLACYELHISLAALQYQAFAQLDDELSATAMRAQEMLRRLGAGLTCSAQFRGRHGLSSVQRPVSSVAGPD